ncbi:hypothetical protein FM111_01810 [Brevundimonas diminuta 3F5N]|uniref:Uncharacterized protein n=1 Tax=Brevundimonas diminuta 3F5N TaxID=1255603 RepID=A0A1R4F0Q1_BREDI|nr:hypothetical protein FM111_01810 [Brevundimonas diminuta 3F5N]
MALRRPPRDYIHEKAARLIAGRPFLFVATLETQRAVVAGP